MVEHFFEGMDHRKSHDHRAVPKINFLDQLQVDNLNSVR
jgi:hypothetical protein